MVATEWWYGGKLHYSERRTPLCKNAQSTPRNKVHNENRALAVNAQPELFPNARFSLMLLERLADWNEGQV